jgi:hypothetical protein
MAKQTFTTGQVLTAAQMTSLQQTAMGGGSTTAKVASYVLVAADAGTVVQMNSASATTITVNTALFAAGDTVQIQNVGAGVCTVTAGTATVSTSAVLALKQYDAGSLYFNSTSAALFFAADAADNTSPLTTKGDIYGFSTLNARIPIGTNNQVLTADSAEALGLKWATPASGSTFVGCSIYATAQNISTATLTNIAYANEFFDSDGFHDNTTNNSRITIPAGKAGKYLLTTTVQFDNNASTAQQILQNGTAIGGTAYGYMTFLNATASRNHIQSTAIVTAAVGDYFQSVAYQASGATKSLEASRFDCTYLGA